MIKEGAAVIDVGINRIQDPITAKPKLVGDVDFEGKRFFLFVFCFLRLNLWHMEIPRLRVESEMQLPAYATATATWDLSRVCDLYHSSQQCQIPDPLSEARD